jgi:hypothetical protein
LRNKFVKALLGLTILFSLIPLNQVSAAGTSFSWPVDNVNVSTEITSNYGYDVLEGQSRFHYGIDIARAGTVPVKASVSGKVIFSGFHTNSDGSPGYGNLVAIQHNIDGKSYITKYAHLRSGLSVSDGQNINSGDVLGYMGSTGASTGQHLHFEVLVGTTNMWDKSKTENPLNYLGKEVATTDKYEVYVRNFDKTGESKGRFATYEAALEKMNQYRYSSIIELSSGKEIKNDGVIRDIKVYHQSLTATGVNYIASFSNTTSARNYLKEYQNMVMVDTSTWKQLDWTVPMKFRYGAFNGSDGTVKDFGVPTLAKDYLQSKNYNNAVVLDKLPLLTEPKGYPTVVWESNPSLPDKYHVTNGKLEARYSIYTAAVYARDNMTNSTLTIE